jgi:hypothetical protein
MPSGEVAVVWNREAFPESERTDDTTLSIYAHIEDAEEATGGKLIDDADEPRFYCDDCETELTPLYDDREDLSTPIVCGHCGGNNTRRLKPMTDGGAVDHDYDENELPASEQIGLDGVQTDPMAGGIAFDLVTRQPLFVHQVVSPTVVEYYEREGFDLLGYKTHPYLPVRPDDTVYECVFITRDAERAHKPGDTYDFPRGRLMHVPIEQAWGESA